MRPLVLAILVPALLAVMWWAFGYRERQKAPQGLPTSYRDISFLMGDMHVALHDGFAELEAAPGSASRIIIRYFGNEIRKDLDGDSREDIAFLFTQETGGSGTYFYLVGALDTGVGWKGTRPVYIGDRIAPQTTSSGTGRQVVVNFADRRPNEPFTVRPSVGKSLYLLLDAELNQFGEVVPQFEGEADSARMSLTMKSWQWVRTQIEDGRVLVPNVADSFSLSFNPDGSFSAAGDCNTARGTYVATRETIVLRDVAVTERACAASQESEFLPYLVHVSGYQFTSTGELVLALQYDSGTITLR